MKNSPLEYPKESLSRRGFLKVAAAAGYTISAVENMARSLVPWLGADEALAQTPALPGGYMGKILRVDLSSGSMRDEKLPEPTILRKYIGGQALATYILLKELSLKASPYDPDSMVIMMTGPLTGTGLTPGGTKVTTVFLSPVTGYTLGRGAASGFWGAYLKYAGYDGLIITGKASRPTYLLINEGKGSLRDAAKVWGKGTRATEEMLREEVKIKDAKVMCIGPAGENLVPSGMLLCDLNHSAAHGGGALFGSKNLKAIVVYGSAPIRIHDRSKLIEAGNRWRSVLAKRTVTEDQKKDANYGARTLRALPNFNFRSTAVADHDRGFDKNEIILRPCFACPRNCPWDVKIGEGSHKGAAGHFNAGTEWLDAFFNLGVKGNDVLYLAERSNDVGVECSHFSCAAGVAFEAWEKGLLGPDKTDGLKLEWGNTEVVDRLLDMTARRQGWLGNLLAEGPTKIAEAIGGDAPKWAVHTKKGTPALHEWRPYPGEMIKELVSTGGMKPQGGGTAVPPPDLQYREKWGPLDREKPDGWARSNSLSEQYRQFTGITGSCWFALMHSFPDGIKSVVDSLNAVTGWNFTIDNAMEAGHRSVILQSLFGVQRGWSAEDDWKNVGARFLEPIPDGRFKGFTIAKWMPDIIQEYYRLTGRHDTSGRPSKETLVKLGMEEFMEWSQPA